MIRIVPAFALLALMVGCSSSFRAADTRMQGAEAEFNVPPKELVARVKQALSEPPLNIGVAEENKGSILTGYQQFPGEFHVARRWQERTRYRIRIVPDFDRPTERAQLVITENTEQRPAEGMKWESIDVLPRPERATELLRQLEPKVSGGAATAATRSAS
ncbi:MAG: hypothetical protein QOF78_2728 [Phycisphaerales bacterium]|jgi:hypothetical protein|nr:hypothetical protein [Phycisphaerales bacterium]